VDLSDEAGIEQLIYFFMDEILLLNGLLPWLMLDWLVIGVDL
jgi:hypothetical protein